jgi:hypothetical protein
LGTLQDHGDPAQQLPEIGPVMTGDLAQWQSRLAKHFAEFQRTRSGTLGAPLFALEHGLDPSEVQAITASVRGQIRNGPPSAEHSLPWIVYSTELGYRFSGDEYWQTFEEETPGWTNNGSRHAIRGFYQSFQQTFNGALPSGPWAEHFSIICWPITHAVLPRDLQRQLAKVLYELRHSYSAELFESPSKLGELIATRAWSGTSRRFQNFAEETQLVGQIAAALLLEGEFGTGRLIHPATLERITSDLDRQRVAREWLRGARRIAKERAQVRGLASTHGKARPSSGRVEDARLDVAALGIEPRLVLRPVDTTSSAWTATLEIPDLGHLLLRFPKAGAILNGSRCVVAGSSGRPLARGRLLHGSQAVPLVRWPKADEVLLQFEERAPELDYLLRTECLLRPGPTWLFRIASDGLAYELRTLRVRAGERYILISDRPLPESTDNVVPLEIKCDGVKAAMLAIPSGITASWEATLRRLGLAIAKTIEVWPAGLAAVAWDGEGRGEWLASERPCLALQADHPVAALVVSLGSDPAHSIELSPVVPDSPIFLELPQLGVGLHNVHLSTRDFEDTTDQPLGDLDVVIRITENRPWAPGVNAYSPLVVNVDPPSPSLEQFWEGHVDFAVNGPPGHQLKATVSLFQRDSDPEIFHHNLPAIALPVTADQWRRQFDRHCRHVPGANPAYDKARICQIHMRAEELGELTLRCEREFTPLRWLVRRDHRQFALTLLNDTDSKTAPLVQSSQFETPANYRTVPASSTYSVPSAGGLFVACLDQYSAAIIAPPAVTGLQDLRCRPSIPPDQRSLDSVLRALHAVRPWGEARLPGDPITTKRQRDVIDAFATHIVQIIGGDHWTREESSTRQSSGAMDKLASAVSRRHEEALFGAVINRDAHELAAATCKKRTAWLGALTKRYLPPLRLEKTNDSDHGSGNGSPATGPDSPEWLSELGLRLASAPFTVEQWAGCSLERGVKRLLEEVPTLARAARLMVLAIDRNLESAAGPGEVYAGWRWQ